VLTHPLWEAVTNFQQSVTVAASEAHWSNITAMTWNLQPRHLRDSVHGISTFGWTFIEDISLFRVLMNTAY